MVAAAEPTPGPRPKLSLRQQQVLAFIVDTIEHHGYPPTIREICRHFGFRSTNGVSDHIKALVRKGYLTHEQSKSRTLRPMAPFAPKGPKRVAGMRPAGLTGIPMLGRIAAGQPILAPEEARPEDNLWVDQSWLGANDQVYALKVSGDSMVEDGILDGDTVFVRQADSAERGEVVVAGIDNDVTLKRYFPEGDRIRLQPANRLMEPIYLYPNEATSTRIMGVVIGVYRRL
jgi:repressor LexA